MPKPSSNRRLFEADGYTFLYWITPDDVQQLLRSHAIELCRHPSTGREQGYKLVGAGSSNLLPFGRVIDPLMKPPSISYPIPAMGDHRLRWMQHFMISEKQKVSTKIGEDEQELSRPLCATPTGALTNSTAPASPCP